jgi:hypothetical protein
MTNKTNPQIIRHGEVILKPISKLPEGAMLKSEVNRQIIAHSETGHHHTLVSDKIAQKFQILTDDNGNTFLKLNDFATLIHEKTGEEVHTPHKVIPAIYQIVIKKQFDYFEKAMKQVRD